VVGFFGGLSLVAYFVFAQSAHHGSSCSNIYGTAIGISLLLYGFYVGLAYCLIRMPIIQALFKLIAWILGTLFSCICISPLKGCLVRSRRKDLSADTHFVETANPAQKV
jgi:hypothetical protein